MSLILKMEAIAAAVHVPVVGNGIPTNNIMPIKEAAFIFFILVSILLSTRLNKNKNIFFSLKNFTTCLYAKTKGIATNVDPITLDK